MALIVAALFLLPGCGNIRGQAQGGGRPQAVSIESTGSQRIAIQRRVDLAGTLTSPDEAQVSSEVSGVVRRVAVELGQEVRRDQVLAELDPRELAFALERADSAVKQTEAQLGIDAAAGVRPPADEDIASVRTASANRDDARAQFARAEELSNRGLLSPVERETAQTRLKIADAAYQSAIENLRSLRASLQDRRASYELARKKLADTTIRAPVDGSVTERFVRPGVFIKENAPVATLMRLDPLRLTTAVQERYADLIRPGMPVQFRVEPFPGQVFEGRIAYVSPATDQSTRTFAVEAEIGNPDRRLKPGFFVNGGILTRIDRDVLAVPEAAVSTMAGVSSVYVVEKGKIRQQRVVLGARQDKLFEVVEGLDGSEQLAASNLNQLATGVVVTLRTSPAGAGRAGREAGAP